MEHLIFISSSTLFAWLKPLVKLVCFFQTHWFLFKPIGFLNQFIIIYPLVCVICPKPIPNISEIHPKVSCTFLGNLGFLGFKMVTTGAMGARLEGVFFGGLINDGILISWVFGGE